VICTFCEVFYFHREASISLARFPFPVLAKMSR
jgi:hypothetical protein